MVSARICFFSILLGFSVAYGESAPQLDFDAEKNAVQIFGPYLKYNFLQPPYSFGVSQFHKKDISIQPITVEGEKKLQLRWPTYFLDSGKIGIFGTKSNLIEKFSFSRDELKEKGGFFTKTISLDSASMKEHYASGFHFCVSQVDGDYSIEVCSDKLIEKNQQYVPLRTTNKVRVFANGAKVPANAQINIGDGKDRVSFLVKFKSGLKVSINEPVYRVSLNQLVIDPKSKSLGIRHKELNKKTTKASFIKKVGNLFREKNYILDKINGLKPSTRVIESDEMEFSPFRHGRSLQLFGIIFRDFPSNEITMSLNPENPQATYESSILLKGTNPNKLKVFTKPGPSRAESSADLNTFTWSFQAPNKGEFNSDVIGTQGKGEPVYYSSRMYRGHKGSIAARVAFTSSLDLSLVPGAQVQGDYWFEKVFSNHSVAFQRWGVAAGYSQTFSTFESKGLGDELTQTTAHVDLLARFNSGVRPLKSTFGLGLRYFMSALRGGDLGDIDPSMLGVGLFWHTAPQGIIDGALSIIPFFRNPKWMEVSVYYYPMTFSSDIEIGVAFSFHWRGRLLITPRWFFDMGINFQNIAFEKTKFGGTASTFDGTLGVGYNF